MHIASNFVRLDLSEECETNFISQYVHQIPRLLLHKALSTSSTMIGPPNYSLILRTVFNKCVNSVKPAHLFNVNKCLELVLPNVRVCNETIEMENKKCHLVGFGKAVLGMAVQVERILGDRLVSGIISVPLGTIEKFRMDEDMQLRPNSVVQVYEGAKNNLPDSIAEQSARKILAYVETLTENDVLFVLISGGGSSLLPIPKPPITLSDKVDVIKMLASRGATINELNTVRIEISAVKGGKLALAARNAYKVISLVMSDICGDPANLIAAGPTMIQKKNPEAAKEILEKYDLMKSLPDSVMECISNSNMDTTPVGPWDNFHIHIIGNNTLAINTAIQELALLDFRAFCMSRKVEGNIEVLSSIYCDIATAIYGFISGRLDKTSFENFMASLDKTLKFEENFIDQLLNTLADKTNVSPICLVAGGESTVTVKGNGIGGRNQELALRIANNMRKDETIRDITFLAAGTDGIDGPCDAAGCVASLDLLNDCKLRGSIESYIGENDSYNLLKTLSGGKYHIITGHTGTNVMDLHFMVIPLTS